MAIAVVLVVVLLDVLLLAFAGVLLAVFLRTLAKALHASTRLPVGWSLVVVIAGLATASGLAFWRLAPAAGREVDQLVQEVPRLFDDATGWLGSYGWGRWLLERSDGVSDWLTEPRTVRRATSFIGTTLGLVGTVFVTGLVGVFIAAEPRTYRDGVLRLVPVARRAQAAMLLEQVARALRAWILGKLVAMVVIFVATWVGLALIGIPLALTLALLAALLTFIPNFGPVLAAAPALLLGMQQGTTTALAVGALYLGTQVLESYLLTPLIQRKAVSLPPALTLLAQLAMGVLAGGLGLLLATPLAAAILTIARGLTPELEDPGARRA